MDKLGVGGFCRFTLTFGGFVDLMLSLLNVVF